MSDQRVTVRSADRGFHWVAWIAHAADDRPAVPALVVGLTQEEAEARARQWWEAHAVWRAPIASTGSNTG
jgi:hypothetical protein